MRCLNKIKTFETHQRACYGFIILGTYGQKSLKLDATMVCNNI